MNNTFGKLFKMEIFGASHAPAVGATVSGCPKGITLAPEDFRGDMARRRPGQALSTPRKEDDAVEISGGVKDGLANGQPITLTIRNTDTRSKDYDAFKRTPRPGHADYSALKKYGQDVDLRGGGIFSGRMTAPIVAAGVIAKKILSERKIKVEAKLIKVGKAERNFEAEIKDALKNGDSIGGLVECEAVGVPIGLGEPFFDSVESVLSHLLFSIPGVKGVEFGSGFGSVGMRGSQHNDAFQIKNGKITTKTNNAGGILGGITNGMPVVFRVAFKPTASIAKEQDTVDLSTQTPAKLSITGRHDPCIALRAVPVVEAAAAIALVDLLLQAEKQKGREGS